MKNHSNQIQSLLVRCVIFTLVMLFSYKIGIAQSNCEFKKTENKIKIYMCENPASPFDIVKAKFEIKATLSQYAAFVMDVDKYPLWRYRATEARLLETISPTELLFYMKVDCPWPVSDRDLVLRLIVTQRNPYELLIVMKSEPDQIPIEDGFVRIKKSHAIMMLTRNNKGSLDADWKIDVNPAGEIPAWVANLFATQGPIATFTAARNYLESQHNLPYHLNIKN